MKTNKLFLTATASTLLMSVAMTTSAFAAVPVVSVNKLPGNMVVIGATMNGNCLPGQLPEGTFPGITFPGTNFPTPELPSEGGETGDVSAYAAEILQLINQERAKVGASPLVLNEKAGMAANVRAKEIVTSFSHTRPNGSDFSTALLEQGVTYTRSGENIAYGQQTPQIVMNGWMNSKGHRENILNPSFTSVGIGHYEVGGVNYWVQLFVR